VKHILITGTESGVGLAIRAWLSQWPMKYQITMISLRKDDWKKMDFSIFDCVYHVSGIAHANAALSMRELYFSINRDLTIEVAKTAKNAGVKQFIFMSSGIVYGDSPSFGKPFVITKDTKPNPNSFYGESKLQAEEGLRKLEDTSFKIVIIRSPALYGIRMKSHYNNLSFFARKHHIFPYVNNERSMLYSKNLAEFVRLMIENEESGIFWPQNKEYTSTVGIIKDVAFEHKRKIFLVPIWKGFFQIGAKIFPVLKKAFSNFTYDSKLSEYKEEYRIYSYQESIHEIENSADELLVEKMVRIGKI